MVNVGGHESRASGSATGESPSSRGVSKSSGRRTRFLGQLLLLACVLCNPWAVGALLAADGRLDAWYLRALVFAAQGIVGAVGLRWTIRPPRPTRQIALSVGLSLALVGMVLGAYGTLTAIRAAKEARNLAEHEVAITRRWKRLKESEDALLEVSGYLRRCSHGLLNLRLPDASAAGVFDDTVRWNDVEGEAAHQKTDALVPSRIRSVAWDISAESRETRGEDVHLWAPLLRGVSYVQNAKLYVIRGRFLDEDTQRYETDVGFKALLRTAGGAWRFAKGSLTIRWTHRPDQVDRERPAWRIYEWRLQRLSTLESEALMFEEVLDSMLPDPLQRVRARHSVHEDLIRSFLNDPRRGLPHPDFTPQSFDRHPGIAVADIDGDGNDDIYVMARWGANQLFLNKGGGTLTEDAGRFGLDIDGHCSSAVFVDLDNDGELDAVVGRTLRPSLVLMRRGGRFVDVSGESVAGSLPSLVSSVTAVDYDGDGLLDIHLATYAAAMITRSPSSLGKYLGPAALARLTKALASRDSQTFRNLPGPQNVLLHNLGGGHFRRAGGDQGVSVPRNTYQATWGDFDGDGDPDVYLANDFAPNNLLRNEGNGRFVDVTDASETADVGFGMGAAWGDYDFDGRLDLYVSNMFSKAGMRITDQLGDLDPRFGKMARGNTLFRNEGGHFRRSSGLKAPALLVEAAGWAWGAQFADVDNDADLDLYSLSGYYTAPVDLGKPDR